MRDLILKDIHSMGRTLKFYTLFLSCYLILALLGPFDVEVAAIMIHMIIMMLPLGLFAHDDEEGEAGQVISRKAVGARYLLVLMAAFISLDLGLFGSVFLSITGAVNLSEQLSVVLLSLGTGLLIADFMLPLCCVLGTGRARPYLYAAILLPMVVLFGAVRVEAMAQGLFNWLSQSTQLTALAWFPLFGLVGLGLSFLVSCRWKQNNPHA